MTIGFIHSVLRSGSIGRPRLEITLQQIAYLLNPYFSCPTLSDILGVSLSTVRRRMTEYGLSISALYKLIR